MTTTKEDKVFKLTGFQNQNLERKLEEEYYQCKGLVFRAEVNNYIGKGNSIVFSTRFKFLKRKSCSGCDQCLSMLDQLQDMQECDGIICDLSKIEDKSLYKLVVTNVRKDWETGYAGDWDFALVPYEEQKNL